MHASTASNAPARTGRTWRFPRLIIEDHIVLAAMIWAGFMVTVIGVAVGIDYFSEVSGSVLVNAANFASWYIAFLTGYVMYQNVPMFIAHGRTRRDTAIEAVMFMVIFAVAGALLITAGYLLEYVVYGIAGWPRDMSGSHLFSTHTEVLAIFWEYWLTFLVWAAAGGFAGAAFYRYDGGGWLALIPAGLLVSLAGVNSGPTFMGFVFRWLPSVEITSVPLFTALATVCFLTGLALTWPIIRDMPIRNR